MDRHVDRPTHRGVRMHPKVIDTHFDYLLYSYASYFIPIVRSTRRCVDHIFMLFLSTFLRNSEFYLFRHDFQLVIVSFRVMLSFLTALLTQGFC